MTVPRFRKKKPSDADAKFQDRSGNWKFELTACAHAASRMPEVMEICKCTSPLQMAICQCTGVGLVVVEKSLKVPPINAAAAGLKPPDLGTGGGRDPHPCRVDGYSYF
jgi:hypothetical protein